MPAITLPRKRGKTWLAEITGKSERFGLERTFIPAAQQGSEEAVYLCEEGKLYQFHGLSGREFFTVVNGEKVAVQEAEAFAWVERIGEAKRRAAGELDDAIVKFNSEGGFSVEPSDN